MKDCNTENFREKAVVNSCDGKIIGHVAEIIFDCSDGRITAIVVREDCGMLSFKKSEDIIIPWCKIAKIGEDVIIVNADGCIPNGKYGKKGKDKDEECCSS